MKDLIKRLALWILQGIIGAVIALAGAVLLIEWMAGCGETYTDSKGNVHANGCVFSGIRTYQGV
jgi:hypothetical protein